MMRDLKKVVVITLVIIFCMGNIYFLYLLKDKTVDKEPIKPKIVLISHIKTNPYWVNIREGAERAAKERGAVIEFIGPTTASTEEGLKLFEMATSAKVSGIITYVQEEGKYKKKINSAMEKGIPVVTIDSDEEDSNRIAYVGTDNILAGQAAGEEMINQIGTEGNVAVVMGGKDVKNQKERVEGFKNYIYSNSNLKIVDIDSSDAMLLEAEIITRKILNRNNSINALFCTSALDGIGAVKAIQGLNDKGQVKIICFDDLEQTLNNIKIKIGDYIKEYINRKYKCIGNYMFYEELTYFIQIENEDTEDFKNLGIDLGFNLRREIKKRFNVSIRAGLGEIYNSVEQIVKSYRQATKCLVYNSDNVNIIHIDDINDSLFDDKFINSNIVENNFIDVKDNKIKNVNKIKLRLFEDVKNFIKENIATELELEKVAGNFGLSVYYFSRTFKEVTGTNYSDYINKCRIDIAKELLSNGEMNVKEVCYKVGYNDPNYFSKVFKKYEGVSPVNFKVTSE